MALWVFARQHGSDHDVCGMPASKIKCKHQIPYTHPSVAEDYSVGRCVLCGETVGVKREQQGQQQDSAVPRRELGQADFFGAEVGREVFGLDGGSEASESQAEAPEA